MRIRVRAPVYPTEDPGIVEKAVSRIYSCGLEVDVGVDGYGEIRGYSENPRCLEGLHRLIREQMIMDAVRKYLSRSRRGNTVTILLHKQALTAGKISLVDSHNESPLGAVEITIESGDPQALIDWLAPKTRHGKPLWEREPPEA